MNQSNPLYDTSPALAVIEPWLRKHLPDLDEAVTRRFIQIVTGIFEQRSLILETIAESSVFTATTESNTTQVRRIIRDQRLTLDAIYYPLVQSFLSEFQTDLIYLTMDETAHGTDYLVFQLGLATDGLSLPLGFLLYETDSAWAEDARDLLRTLDTYIPDTMDVVLLADRIHSGEPFLACLDELRWDYVFRAPQDTYVEVPSLGWRQLKQIYKPRSRRYLTNVRVWKSSERRTNVSIYKHARKGFRPVTWYVLSSFPAAKERFAEYACRWWMECTFKDLKSAMFQWERGRVVVAERVIVLLMGVGCAIWAMWLLGRSHEHTPRRKPTTTRPQKRRKSLIKQGCSAFTAAKKRKQLLTLPTLHEPRVLDYERVFK